MLKIGEYEHRTKITEYIDGNPMSQLVVLLSRELMFKTLDQKNMTLIWFQESILFL